MDTYKKSANRAFMATFAIALLLLGAAPLIQVRAQSQTFLFNNNAFSGSTNSVVYPSPAQPSPWEAVIQTDLQWNTLTNQTATELFYSTQGTMQGGGSGQTYTCHTTPPCTWTDLVIYVVGNGALTVIYNQNTSVAASTATVYQGPIGTLGTGSTTSTTQIDSVVVDYYGANTTDLETTGYTPSSGLLVVSSLTPNGQTETPLFNLTITGFDMVNAIGVANANSGTKPTASAGFQQITVQDLPVSVNINSTFNVIIAIIPLVIVIAVVGMVVRFLNSFFKTTTFKT